MVTLLDQLLASPHFIRSTTPHDLGRIETALGLHLPDDYRDFAGACAGFEGEFGESYLVLFSANELLELNQGYNMAEFYPGAILIGSDGGGEMFCIDCRTPTQRYVLMPFIGSWTDAIDLGGSLEEMLTRAHRGTLFNR